MAYTILEKKRFVFSLSEFTTRLHSLSPHRVAHAQNAAHCSRLSHRSFRFKSLRFYKTAIQILNLFGLSRLRGFGLHSQTSCLLAPTHLHSLSPHRVAHAQNAAHCSRLSHRSFRFKSLRFYKTAIQILKLRRISETKRI